MNTLTVVTPETLNPWWGKVEPMIAKALRNGTGMESSHSVLRGLRDGSMQMLVLHDPDAEDEFYAVVVASVIHYDETTALRVNVVAGYEYQQWRDLIEKVVVRWAKTNDCEVIESFSRPGASAVLRDLGYRVKCHMLVKEV